MNAVQDPVTGTATKWNQMTMPTGWSVSLHFMVARYATAAAMALTTPNPKYNQLIRGSNPLTINTPAKAKAKKNHWMGRILRWWSNFVAKSTVNMGLRYWITVALARGIKRIV